MKKCVIIPDSFKGTLSSIEICDIVSVKVKEFYPACETITIPIADGGEGTVDCFLQAIDADKVNVSVTGPYNELLNCYYARYNNTAIIEMAQSAGLPLVENRKNPAITTTYGTGLMIKHAIENGCTDIVIGLGGSCTNDAGVGAACAIGVDFYDDYGNTFLPTGNTLSKISKIDNSKAIQLLNNCTVTAMCDIDNPMYGKTGAAYIFSPQKGADDRMVLELDENLKALSATIIDNLGIDVSNIPGSGAAGAMGAGVVAFFNGKLKSGIHTILDLIQFDELIEGTDLIFTGEGKIDSQSLRGKVVIGVAERALKKNIPVVAIVGAIGEEAEKAYDMGVSSIFSINRAAIAFEESRYHSKENLASTIESLMRFRKICK
ncbi:MAG: glycerate kinase [Clostridiales bacterium]|jgi:glycerate kinase|nr:glycerate kinase [Clostridiales bacterium]